MRAGAGLLILSDRDVGCDWAPLPMLLATAAVHHRLLRAGLRTRAAIVCDTGEPREDHHYACLIGYGAALVHPYLALATARDVPQASRRDDPVSPEAAVMHYRKAVEKGLLKIMSKMGISALSSYRGAQIFEAVGIDQSVIGRYFVGTPSRIGGAGLEVFGTDALRFHAEAYGENPTLQDPTLQDKGLYRFRKAGEYHALNPLVFKALHKAVRTESFEAYGEYSKLVDERTPCNLRDLLQLKRAETPLPLDKIEPVESIVTRFSTQAMSHGSVSREAHETLAVAMNRLGAKSNSGEGGEDPVRFHAYETDRPDLSQTRPGTPKAGDWANSAIKQVASGRFGVTPDYLVSAQELEIKMAQGSKPGEGGQIPGTQGQRRKSPASAVQRAWGDAHFAAATPRYLLYRRLSRSLFTTSKRVNAHRAGSVSNSSRRRVSAPSRRGSPRATPTTSRFRDMTAARARRPYRR